MNFEKILDCSGLSLLIINDKFEIIYSTTTATSLFNNSGNSDITGKSLIQLGLDVPSQHRLDLSSPQSFTLEINGNQYDLSMNPYIESIGEPDQFVVSIQKSSNLDFLSTDIQKLTDQLQLGIFDQQLAMGETPVKELAIRQNINTFVGNLKNDVSHLTNDLSTLAECNFDFRLTVQDEGMFGSFHDKLVTTVSNLNEALKQMIEFAEIISSVSASLAQENEELNRRTAQQASEIEITSTSMEELTSTVKSTATNAIRANTLANEASELARGGQDAVVRLVHSIQSISDGSSKIEGIITLINEIAFQTNILSLNAAVEAARAGEQGRGFAVVASEVRNLAGRCSDAASDIKHLITDSKTEISNGQLLAKSAEDKMVHIVDGVKETSDIIKAISIATDEQSKGIEYANGAIGNIDTITQQNKVLVSNINQNTRKLDKQARYLFDAVNVFKLQNDSDITHPTHATARMVSQQLAADLGKVLENAVRNGSITSDALFDREYRPIQGTNPQKFHTQYDRLTDELFPAFQDKLLEEHPFLVLATGVDDHGYIPTHNSRYRQKLTGNYEVDLAKNRTKRIFDDRVGETAGQHEQPFKLQTYRRDTGELMFDVSSPIYVSGRHWGGVRVGYRIE